MRRVHSSKPSPLRRLVMVGAVLATLAGVGAAPALADDWGHRGDGWRHEEGRGEAMRQHEWREHEWREHEWREHEWRERHAYAYGAPRYYYAPGYAYTPPPVAYPPAYVAPGFNLGFYFR